MGIKPRVAIVALEAADLKMHFGVVAELENLESEEELSFLSYGFSSIRLGITKTNTPEKTVGEDQVTGL